MVADKLIPAAEYVRMSTEDQKYSIPNQQAAIRRYAAEHGFVVCRTYADPGKSGVAIRHREGLSQLLQDVVGGRANYDVVLVYDVSRWGRFQNPDEAAHYEFICASASIPVHYCAEQFSNDGSIQSSLMKAIKRTMAAEFSRELGVKVFDGLKRLVSNGFHAGGTPPYGLRRMLISESGKKKAILKARQLKNLKTDRVVLVRGARNEVRRVRQLFSMAANEGMNSWEIADELNARHVPYRNGKRWDPEKVLRILRRVEYTGVNVWGRRLDNTYRPSRKQPRTSWVISKAWFRPIIDQATFDAAQRSLEKARPIRYTDEYLLKALRRLLARKGRLSGTIIDQSSGIGYSATLVRHFGSLLNAYKLVGYEPKSAYVKGSANTHKVRVLHMSIMRQIQERFPEDVRLDFLYKRFRYYLVVDKSIRVVVLLCGRPSKAPESEDAWLLRISPSERQSVALLCLLDRDWDKVVHYRILPPLGNSVRNHHTIHKHDPLLTEVGQTLTDLKDFCRLVHQLCHSRAANQPSTASSIAQ